MVSWTKLEFGHGPLQRPELNDRRFREITDCDPLWGDLEAYYYLNEGSGTVFLDKTGNCHNGTLQNGAAFSADRPGLSEFCGGGDLAGYPDPDVQGGNPPISIADNDNTPSFADSTNFGSFQIGTGGNTNTFTLYNNGDAPLNLTGGTPLVVTGSGASNYSIVQQPTTPVPAMGSTTFKIRFEPTAFGTHLATARIDMDDCDIPQYNFDLTGNGTCPAGETFEGPGTDWSTDANWCDGSNPGCGAFTADVVIDSDCNWGPTCDPGTFFLVSGSTFDINTGNTLTVNMPSGGIPYLRQSFTNNGTVVGTTILNLTGNGGNAHVNNGTMTGYFRLQDANVDFTNSATGIMNITEQFMFWVVTGTVVNDGTINVSGGGYFNYFNGSSTFTNNNTINFNNTSGTNQILNFNNGPGGLVTIGSSSTLQVTGGTAFNHTGAEMTVDGALRAGAAFTNNGLIKGTGTLFSDSDALVLGGGVRPAGASTVGIMSTTNDIEFAGSIDIDITGNGDGCAGTAGTDFDQFSSTNSGDIIVGSSTVNFNFGGYTPENGDTYTVFETGGVVTGTPTIGSVSGGITMAYEGNGVFSVVSGGTGTGDHEFNGSTDTDFYAGANWCPGTGYACDDNIMDNVIIDANCLMQGCSHTDFNGDLTINAGKTLTYMLTSFSRVESGGIFTNNGTFVMDGSIGGYFTIDDNVTHVNNGIININDNQFRFQNGNPTLENNGTINVTSGEFGCWATTATLDNNNIINTSNGGMVRHTFGAGVLNILNSGTMNLNNTSNTNELDNLTNETGGVVNLNANATVGASTINNGTIKGTGQMIGDFTNGSMGTLAPGASPGCMTITGNYTNTGTLEIEVEGTTACTQHDQLIVTGTANLGGTLDFPPFGGGYTGAACDEITIIDAATISGTFASVTGLPANWTLNYDYPNAGEVTIVYNQIPEMDVQGGNPLTSIMDGSTTPSFADSTDFGNVLISGATNVNTFTIENSGNTLLSLSGSPRVDITGTHSSDFSLTVVPTTPVTSGGGTTTFKIEFDPSAFGLRTATVSIDNNDCDEDPYTFDIQGTGSCPAGETFEGPGTDYYDDAQWCDGTSPGSLNIFVDVTIGSNCIMTGETGQSDFYEAFEIDPGVTLTYDNGSQCIIRGANGLFTNNGTLIVNQTFQLGAVSPNHLNAGTITVNAGKTMWMNGGDGFPTLQNTGTMTIDGTFNTATDSHFDNDNDFVISSGGNHSLNAMSTMDNSGTVTINGTASWTGSVTNTGTVKGTGTISGGFTNGAMWNTCSGCFLLDV